MNEAVGRAVALADAGLTDFVKVTIEPRVQEINRAVALTPERAVDADGVVTVDIGTGNVEEVIALLGSAQ